jgi:hypothetical protein
MSKDYCQLDGQRIVKMHILKVGAHQKGNRNRASSLINLKNINISITTVERFRATLVAVE